MNGKVSGDLLRRRISFEGKFVLCVTITIIFFGVATAKNRRLQTLMDQIRQCTDWSSSDEEDCRADGTLSEDVSGASSNNANCRAEDNMDGELRVMLS